MINTYTVCLRQMYSIPKDDRLADAIFTVMYRNNQVRSQSELARLVRKELDNDKKDYRVSEERIRTLAIRRGMASVHIDLHETDETELPDTCPVCRHPMESVLNMTIYGKTTEVGRKCSGCPYSMGTRRRIPGRYVFTRPRR